MVVSGCTSVTRPGYSILSSMGFAFARSSVCSGCSCGSLFGVAQAFDLGFLVRWHVTMRNSAWVTCKHVAFGSVTTFLKPIVRSCQINLTNADTLSAHIVCFVKVDCTEGMLPICYQSFLFMSLFLLLCLRDAIELRSPIPEDVILFVEILVERLGGVDFGDE
jgi:hypothetical protein